MGLIRKPFFRDFVTALLKRYLYLTRTLINKITEPGALEWTVRTCCISARSRLAFV
jgi:hypothetical protein